MLRWRLTLPAAAVVLALGVTLIAIGFWDTHRVVSATANYLVRHSARDVSDDLGELLDRSNRVLSRVEHEIARNAIPVNDPRSVQRELYAVLTDEPKIDGLFFANDAGGVVSATRLENGETALLMTDDFRAGIMRQFDTSPDGEPGKLRKSGTLIDARQTIWYKQAQEARGRYWTEPYLGSSVPVFGISLVAPVFGDGGRFEGVIGTRLILASLVKQLQSRPLGNAGRVFVMDAAGQLIAASGTVPAAETDAKEEQRRVAAANAPDPVVRETARHLLAQPGFPWQLASNGAQSFVFWSPTLRETFAAVSMFHAPGDVTWMVVAAIPASDLLGPTERTVLILFIISLAVVSLTVFLGYWFVGRTLRPLGALTQAAQSIARGEWRDVPEMQRDDEVGLLATAFRRMTTSLRDTQESLRLSEESYRSFFENAVEGIIRTDVATGRLLRANPAAVRMLGYASAQEMSAEITNSAEQVWTDPRAREALFDRLLTEGAVTGFEIEVKRRDGERIIVLISSRIIRDRAGQPLYVESFLADITNSKRAEQALLDARAQLAHVARVMTLGEMAASIAHEVRQPLAAVVLNARAGMRWLARQPADLQAARKTLEAIVSDSQRTAEVIARIRAWAKRTPPETDSLDVNEVITEVVALTRSEASRHRVALETRLDNDVPLVKGDRVSLEQVVVNLVMNAVESIAAAGDGPRELIICSGRSELGDVLVAVRDTGKGLQPEHRERIFEAFFTTKATGLGMGLRISRTIIEGHGGRLWATANSPRGAVFSFTLPSRDKAAAAQQTTPSAAVQ